MWPSSSAARIRPGVTSMIRALPCTEVGDHAGLGAGERPGLGAERGDGHRDQRVGDPLTGGQQHVQLAGRRRRRDLLGQVHQLVGGVAHRARRPRRRRCPSLRGGDDPLGDPLDPLRRADRRTAVLLDDQAHRRTTFHQDGATVPDPPVSAGARSRVENTGVRCALLPPARTLRTGAAAQPVRPSTGESVQRRGLHRSPDDSAGPRVRFRHAESSVAPGLPVGAAPVVAAPRSLGGRGPAGDHTAVRVGRTGGRRLLTALGEAPRTGSPGPGPRLVGCPLRRPRRRPPGRRSPSSVR